MVLGAPFLCWRVHACGLVHRVRLAVASLRGSPHVECLLFFLRRPESWSYSQIIITFIFCFYERHLILPPTCAAGRAPVSFLGSDLPSVLPCVPWGRAQGESLPPGQRTKSSRAPRPARPSALRRPHALQTAVFSVLERCEGRCSGRGPWEERGCRGPCRTAGPQLVTPGWGREHGSQGVWETQVAWPGPGPPGARLLFAQGDCCSHTDTDAHGSTQRPALRAQPQSWE